MLPQLQAEQQLAAIEAASVPHMKPEMVDRVLQRHVRRAKPERQEHKAKSLHEALLSAGIPVKQMSKQETAADATGQAGTGRKGKRD